MLGTRSLGSTVPSIGSYGGRRAWDFLAASIYDILEKGGWQLILGMLLLPPEIHREQICIAFQKLPQDKDQNASREKNPTSGTHAAVTAMKCGLWFRVLSFFVRNMMSQSWNTCRILKWSFQTLDSLWWVVTKLLTDWLRYKRSDSCHSKWACSSDFSCCCSW